MGGIIMGAMGGMGEAMQGVGKSMLQDSFEADKEQRTAALAQQTHAANSQVDLQRAQALEDYKAVVTSRAREGQVSRINDAAGGIVNNAMNQKYAGSDAAVAAAAGGASPEVSAAEGNDNVQAALTPQQQAVIDQSKASDRTAMMADPTTRINAAIQTGDIAPKDAMANSTKTDVAVIRAQAAQDVQNTKTNAFMEKLAYMNDKADKDRASREMIATMRAIGNGKGDSETAKIKTATTYLDTVNAERKAAGDDPMTFEEAYQIANYAPKANQDDSIRARVVLNLSQDTRLAKDPVAFKSAVDNMMSNIKDTTPAAPAAKPSKPAASSARPPLSSFLK